MGPTALSSGESSVTSMLTAAMCGCRGCALSPGTPQRKPEGAGIQPRAVLAGTVTITIKEESTAVEVCGPCVSRSGIIYKGDQPFECWGGRGASETRSVSMIEVNCTGLVRNFLVFLV